MPRLLPLYALALVANAGCSSAGDSASGYTTGPRSSDESGAVAPDSRLPSTTAEQVIAEADIVHLRDGLLYAMSKSGTVSIVDVSEPDELTLLGQTEISGVPFEMYLRGHYLLAMSDDLDVSPDGSGPASAVITALDVSDPEHLSVAANLPVPGQIADSRVVSNVLYLATYEDAQCYDCGKTPRTIVTSFDVSEPAAIAQVDQASFESNASNRYNLAWGSHWKRSIYVNEERLYVGGHANIDPNTSYYDSDNERVDEGIIDVLDISDPSGLMQSGARLRVAGAVLSRWQMEERDGMLRVISQTGAGRTGNGIGEPEVDIFRIDSSDSFEHIGHTTLKLPRQEGLRTVRFDTDRAYAITYNQTDPLFVIDLHDPTAPQQRGELHMPGFMFYLEPYGDRLVGLGIDRDDPSGSINVSLFDVRDMDNPTMLGRVGFAANTLYEDYQILNGELPEDQDRIQKAFRVMDDGLVAVPFSGPQGCGDPLSGVQLVNWNDDTLSKGAFLPVPGNPRRALEIENKILAVSDSNVRVFELSAERDDAVQKADLTIGECVQKAQPYYGGFAEGDYHDGYYYCSLTESPRGARHGFASLLLLGIAMMLTTRTRS